MVTEVEMVDEEFKESESVTESNDEYNSPNQWVVVINRIRKNKIAKYSFYYIMFNILLAIFYPVFLSNDPTSLAPGSDSRYGGGAIAFPNLKYPFGTSQLGFNTYSRIIAGTQTSILVGLFATMIAVFIGVFVGLMAGYYKGRVEEVLMRITDLFLAVPFLIIALILIQIIDSGKSVVFQNVSEVVLITFLIGIFGWAGLARLVTANVKQVAALEYVQAVRIMGARDRRIIGLHILPNVLAPIIVITALTIAGSILSEAGLAFLGFADPANTLSWGIEVSINRDILRIHPDQTLIPGFAIFFLVLAVNIFGDTVRDALDPRLKE